MAARSLWSGVAAGVAALACSAPALGALPATSHGVLVPVERTAAPVLGWEPLVPRGRDVPAEPEFEAPFQTSTTTRGKNVVSLTAPQTAAARTFGSCHGFPGPRTSTPGNHDPADVQAAVGAGDVVQLVNTVMNVWTTGGTLLRTLSLQSLIGSTDRLGDPRILFDTESGRWFVSAMDITPDHYSVKVGVSQTSDPTGTWSFYGWDSPLVSECLDQPRIGYSSQVVAFSANVYDGCASRFGPVYVGTQLWVLNKAQLLAGQMAQYMSWSPTGMLWSVQPVQSLSASNVEYAVAVSGDIFRVLTITGVPPAATSYTSTDLPISTLKQARPGRPGGWALRGRFWDRSHARCGLVGRNALGDFGRRVRAAGRHLRLLVRPRHVRVDVAGADARRSRSHARARVVRLLPGGPAGRSGERSGRLRLFVPDRLPERGSGDEARTGALEPVAAARGRDGDADERAVGRLLRRGGRSGRQRAGVGLRAGRDRGRRHATGTRLGDDHRVGHAGRGPAPRGDVPGTERRTITKTSATILGSVDPQSDETTYRFEYGKTATPYRFATPWTALPPPLQPTDRHRGAPQSRRRHDLPLPGRGEELPRHDVRRRPDVQDKAEAEAEAEPKPR